MDPVLQWVQVTWTKASRGAPGATARNAVAAGFVLPSPAVPLWHDVTATERDGFEPRESWRVEAMGAEQGDLVVEGDQTRPRHGRVMVRSEGDDLHVQLAAVRGWGHASPRRHPAVRLARGEWVRWIVNHRFSGTRGWSYSQVTVNLANGAVPLDAFLAEPTVTVDERVSLF